MASRLFLLLFALLSGGASASQWRYSGSVDPMTSQQVSYAEAISDNSISLGFPYQGENRGKIMVRRHPKMGTDVLFIVDKGQLMCPAYSGCHVSIRFDGEKPARFSAVGASDGSSEVLFLNDAQRFIGKAKKAGRILVQAEMYQAGHQIFEFKLPVELVWGSQKK